MQLQNADNAGFIEPEEEIKNNSKMKKNKNIKQIQIEQDKWKDHQESRKCKDISEMSYWQAVSNCSVL